MTQTTQGTGVGSVERVFPKILNGVVKEENLSTELNNRLFLMPQNNIGDNNYTLALEDNNKHVYATDCTVTVPYYSDVDFEVGTRITIVVGGSSIVVERDGVTTSIYAPDSDYGSYVVGARSVVHLLKVEEEVWYLYGDNISDND